MGIRSPEPEAATPFLLTEDTRVPRDFKTRMLTQVMENGPTPDTAAFIQKVEEVRYLPYLGT